MRCAMEHAIAGANNTSPHTTSATKVILRPRLNHTLYIHIKHVHPLLIP
jgi:hypothetical protein